MSGRDTWTRSEVLVVKMGEQRGSVRPPSLPPPLRCTPIVVSPYPLVHPTSIPLQFLSTFCSPLKEIGFKPWHTLAPPDWLDTTTPRGHSTKKETHFFPSSSPLHFNPFPISYTLALYIMCPSIPYPLLLLLLFLFTAVPAPSLTCPSLRLILFFPEHAFLSVSCQRDISPPPSVWWAGATGFWWSNLLTKTAWHQKNGKKGSRDRQRWIPFRRRQTWVCVLTDQNEKRIVFYFPSSPHLRQRERARDNGE